MDARAAALNTPMKQHAQHVHHGTRRTTRREAMLAGATVAASWMSGRGVHAAPVFDHEHAAWTSLLRAYVHEGNVAYAEMSGDVKALDAYLAALSAVDARTYAAFKRAQQLAFCINAHNAWAVKLVLDHHPVDSVRSIGLLPGSALKKAFIPLRALGPEDLSLEDLSGKIIPALGDARALLCLSAGAVGGPMLRAGAYRADALNAQLEDACFRFGESAARVKIDAGARTVHVSAVLERHRAQVEAEAGSIVGFVARYVPTEAAELLRAPGKPWKVAFIPVDWALNGR